MSFFSELRRRNVYRVATAYIIVGWLIMQVVDVMQPALLLPEWIARLFAVVLLIGFPIAMVLAWIFDITPEGIVRTDAEPADAAARQHASRRLDLTIIIGLVLVAGLIVWQQLRPADDPRLSLAPDIAVLPFEDLSQQGDQQYFADGVSEEILNLLARQPDLRVTGRTSSFSFRGSDKTLRDIGNALGVSAILEGSVRKQGNQVRILARLVIANDGSTLWNETYEAELVDIFAVQDRIAEAVFAAMATQLDDDGTTDAQAPSFEVYDRYLRARELISSRQVANLEEAQDLLLSVVAIEPDYAALWAQLALSERLLSLAPGGGGTRPITESYSKAVNYVERAMELDTGLADAHAVRGLLYLDDQDLPQAEASLRRALEINPAHTNARLWLGLCLNAATRYRDAANEMQALFEVDPLFPPVSGNLVSVSIGIGDAERARQVFQRLERIEASAENIAAARARYEEGTGNLASAIRRMQRNMDNSSISGAAAPIALMQLRLGDVTSTRFQALPFVPIRSALLEGRGDDAAERAATLLARSDNYYVFQFEYIRTLADAGMDEQLIAYYQETFGDIETYERSLFWAFDPVMPPFWALAYAMHRSGADKNLDTVMTRWRQAIDIARANGADNYDVDLNEAQWYALKGETEDAVAYLERAAGHGRGLLEARLLNDYLNTLLGGHPGFEELMANNLRRINEERAALDLDALAL
ncbi:MAG: tetratricopeptide repeat protein [Pseudomonadota bacterium]